MVVLVELARFGFALYVRQYDFASQFYTPISLRVYVARRQWTFGRYYARQEIRNRSTFVGRLKSNTRARATLLGVYVREGLGMYYGWMASRSRIRTAYERSGLRSIVRLARNAVRAGYTYVRSGGRRGVAGAGHPARIGERERPTLVDIAREASRDYE